MPCLHPRLEEQECSRMRLELHLDGRQLWTCTKGNARGIKVVMHARMIPRLREIHIIRDSWTKLNVTPAKIMQVCSKVIINIINLAVYIHAFVAKISPFRTVSVRQQ